MTRSEKYLTFYSSVLTAAFVILVLTGARANGNTKFEEIDVQRVNVVEPDGKLRMVISNKARFPGAIFKGTEHAHERGAGGVLFFNDEETENGGLIFAGKTDEQGKVSHFVHLSMDQYQQDQVVALNSIEQAGARASGLTIADKPDRPIVDDLIEREKLSAMPEDERNAMLMKRMDAGYYGADRIFLGRNRETQSALDLKDASGKTRLRLRVQPDGQAAIEFLDAEGDVQRRVTPEVK